MDGSPRATGQAQQNRQSRRDAASPYTSRKPSTPTKQEGTPSRLSGIISSLWSPFSRKAKAPSPEVEEEQDDDEENGAVAGGTTEDQGEQVLVLEGSFTGSDLEGHAPPSPTPASNNLYPNLTFSSSKSVPSFATSAFSTPRLPGHFTGPRSPSVGDWSASTPQWARQDSPAPPQHRSPASAQEELARFFKEKAESGGAPLSAVEQAGVLQLMQQAQMDNLPTAFRPQFPPSPIMSTPGPFRQPLPPSTFSPPTSHATPPAESSTSSPFRRRRSVYVGAGYSSQSARRRKAATPSMLRGNEGDLSRSQSDGAVYKMANEESSVAEGKRRKVDEPAEEQDTTRSLTRSSTMGALSSSAFSAPVSRAVATTPARPSPLWQVSKADTPSPSPPKKSAPAKAATRAADLMMDIIRQEDAARPAPREAVVNPYDAVDSPMARIPRSRPARTTTPRKSPAVKAATRTMTPLQTLEATMPASLREESKRMKPNPPPAAAPAPVIAPPALKPAPAKAPATAPAKKTTPAPKLAPVKKPMEVVELSDSDEDEDEIMSSEEEVAPPPKANSKAKATTPVPTSKASAPALTSKTPTEKWIPPIAASPFSFTPQPVVPQQSNIRETPAVTPPPKPTSPTLPPPAPMEVTPTKIKASLPPTPPPQSAPFKFVPVPTIVEDEQPTTVAEAKTIARNKSRMLLPTYDFSGVFGKKGEEKDAVVRSTMDIVKGMSRSELPSYSLL